MRAFRRVASCTVTALPVPGAGLGVAFAAGAGLVVIAGQVPGAALAIFPLTTPSFR